MRSKINKFFKYFMTGFGVYYFISLGYMTYLKLNDNSPKINIKVERMLELPKIDAVITDYSLMENYKYFGNQILKSGKLDRNFYKYYTPNINILIDSNGGYVSYGFNIIKLINSLKEENYNVVCYVTKAYSMAFTILQSCSKRIILKNGYLMMHMVRGESKYSSYLQDIRRAKSEVRATGKDYTELLKLRSNGDRFFTAEEALKENLVDDVL